MILGALALIGVLLAWLLGADPRRLALVRLRATWVVFLALGVQILLFTDLPRSAHVPLPETAAHLASYAALLIFAVANIQRPGFAIATAGCTLNAIAIVANGGKMPVSLASWTASGGSARALAPDGSYHNVVVGAGANLAWLGDIFPLPRIIPLANSLSLGDLLLLLGVTVFAFRGSLPPTRRTYGRTLELLAHRSFRNLLLGRTVSKLGDWLTMTAVVTWIYVETRSSLLVSVFLVVRIAATVAGGLIATPLLDRFARFRTLWFVEVVRGALMLGTMLLAMTGNFALVIAFVSMSAALSAATDPSSSSLVPELLPVRLVHAGNAFHGVVRNVMMVVGTLAGGLAVARLGISGALLVDVATFAAAALLYRRLAAVSVPIAQETAPAVSRRSVLLALVRQPVALGLTASFAVVTGAMAILNASIPAFFDKQLGDAHAYGYGLAAIGAGLLCGEALSGCVRQDSVARRSVPLAFALCGATVLVLAETTAQSTAYLLLFLLGASDGTTEVVYDTLFQARFPRKMLGGAFALAAAIQRTGMIVGFLVAPVLLAVGWRAALAASSLVCLVGASLAAATIIRPSEHVRQPYLEPESATGGS